MSSHPFDWVKGRLIAGLASGLLLATTAMAAVPGNTPDDIARALGALSSVEVVQAAPDGMPTFLRGDLGQVPKFNATSLAATESTMRQVLAPVLAAMRLRPAALQLRKVNVDPMGNQHLRYNLTHRGLPVVGGDMVVHVDGKGRVFAINGTGRGDIAASLGERDIGASAVHPAVAADARFAGMASTPPRKVYFVTPEGGRHMAYETVVTGQRGQDPVRDKVYVDVDNGDIVAVLDVSGPVSNHDLAVGIAVQTAGFALSRALRASAFADANGGALGAIERLVHHASGPAMLIEASGVVRVVNERARAALPLPPPGAALSCERVFGVSFPELDAAAGQKDTRFQTRTGTYRLTIDRVAGDARRTLALLVYFEYQASPTTRSGSTQVSTPPALEPSAFDVILGNDVSLVRAKALASRFAKTELPVLLLAETGTGKELFAHAIHETSPRAARPFVALNCGALSPQLIASELFGHGPGAFTGASRGGTEGRIGAASGGTLFLDEIAEMPEDLQAALLRVLDDGVYQRVGETRDRRADFRLVSATSRDLPAMVRDGRFRSDLFYRIKGACVTIPALRDRSDVAFVAERLLHASMPGASLAMDASQFIAEHTWPGNVRELKSAIMHALALADGTVITRAHLPDVMITGLANTSDPAPTTRKALVREAIDATLRVCAGNVSEAARRLGVGRGTIYRAVRKPPTR